MEINGKQSFYFAIKGSLRPFVSSLGAATNKMEVVIQKQTYKVLENPLLSTSIIACIMLFLIFAMTLSTLVVAGALCIAVVIIIVEGFVLGMIIGLAAAITASVFMVIIIMIGLISTYKGNK